MKLSTFDAFKSVALKDGMVEVTDGKLVALQHLLLEMLDDIHSVCSKNKIEYFLSGGTMLGAVRHNGFIPWDDDLDIFMTRQNFNKFRTVFSTEMGKQYVLQTPKDTSDYGISVSKIRKKNTLVRDKADSDKNDSGAWVDIFILENTYNNPVMRKIHEILSMAAGFALSCRMFYSRRDLYMSFVSEDKQAQKTFKIKICIGFVLSFFSLDFWARMTDRIYSMCKNDYSNLVVCPTGRKHFSGEIFPRDPFCKLKDWKFENHSSYISEWYDSYLIQIYGDYMKIPPESERETHVVLEFDLGDAYKEEE